MTDHQNADQYYQGKVYRVVWGVFGLFLTGLGICVVFFGVVGLPIRIGAGLLMTLLGANAVWTSVQSTESWLAKFLPFFDQGRSHARCLEILPHSVPFGLRGAAAGDVKRGRP